MAARSQSSLFRRLLLGFSGVVLVAALLGFAHTVYDAKRNQQDHTDIENRANARAVMHDILHVAGDPGAVRAAASDIERLRRQMFRELDFRSRVRLRIWQGTRLLYNSMPGLPDRLPAPGSAAARHANAWVSWTERDAASGLVVERCHEVDDNWMFSLAGASFLLSPMLVSLPFLLVAAWIIIRIGLRPMRDIAAAIGARSSADLTPLADTNYRELSPLIEAINRLMARLSERLAREHEFLTDAAHELKTPLAAIQLNSHLLLGRAADGARGVEASEGLCSGVARATHTVHQLLAYERAGAGGSAGPLPVVELEGFVRDRLAAVAPLAIQRGIEIELRADAACPMALHQESMAALVDNLIGNAIKYSPDGGRIVVRLSESAHGPRLAIDDQGPGIAPHLRRKVFERFYRIPGQDQVGTGLGLAIAERAAARNGGAIRLEDGAEGAGLSAIAEFARHA